ncbi:MAG: hypothetical protein HYY17_09510, partial [Planctomycetes bacterium]|nr:hypothetical protein [Planctomycetota bacterium]
RDDEKYLSDPLAGYPAYVKALEFYDRVADDTDLTMRDPRARVIALLVATIRGPEERRR